MDLKALCILVCAGTSSRMGELGSAKSKVLLHLDSSYTVLHEVLSRLSSSGVKDVILVCPENIRQVFLDTLDSIEFIKPKLVSGGKNRCESVKNGLSAIADLFPSVEHDIILVHDGARPFFSVNLLKNTLSMVKDNNQGYVFAVPVTNTIKVCSEDNTIDYTLDRSTLWEIQTPQVFPKEILLKAYAKSPLSDTNYDDSVLVEKLPHKVSVVKSDYSNFKITTPEDIQRAEIAYKSRLDKPGKGTL